MMDTYEELTDYLKADLETRYKIHKDAYFKLYPASNIEKFYRFEIAYLKRQINKYEKRETVEPLDTEIYISQIEVLEYINSISSNKAPQQTEIKTEQETIEKEHPVENDFTLSTIEDWLFEFKDKMIETDYQTLVSALIHYFENGTFPALPKPIQINGRPNKKLFGWALNRIFESKGKGIEKALLQFSKENISLFAEVEFDENNVLKSNLYKYFSTKTK